MQYTLRIRRSFRVGCMMIGVSIKIIGIAGIWEDGFVASLVCFLEAIPKHIQAICCVSTGKVQSSFHALFCFAIFACFVVNRFCESLYSSV